MKYLLAISIAFCTLFATAQQKGASPISTQNSSLENQNSSTYAVVVGISDYQDEGIPDLRFADKDALRRSPLFYNHKAGGSLDEDHLKVLINEQATVAQFAIAPRLAMGSRQRKRPGHHLLLRAWGRGTKKYHPAGLFALLGCASKGLYGRRGVQCPGLERCRFHPIHPEQSKSHFSDGCLPGGEAIGKRH